MTQLKNRNLPRRISGRLRKRPKKSNREICPLCRGSITLADIHARNQKSILQNGRQIHVHKECPND